MLEGFERWEIVHICYMLMLMLLLMLLLMLEVVKGGLVNGIVNVNDGPVDGVEGAVNTNGECKCHMWFDVVVNVNFVVGWVISQTLLL